MKKLLSASTEVRKKRRNKIIAVCGLLLIAVVAVFAVIHAVDRYKEEQYLKNYGQTALTVGEYTVTFDTYRYFYCNYRDELTPLHTAEDGSVNTAALDRDVRTRVSEAVCGLYGTVSLAADYGITLTDKDVTEVADSYVEAVESYYKDSSYSYENDLAANYMTEQVFAFLMRVDALEDKLFDMMTAEGGKIESDDEKLAELIRGDDFVRIKLLFIENDDGEDVAQNRKIAEEALTAYHDGKAFDTLIGLYSEDLSMPADGYYFTHMEMIDEIEQSAFSLVDGEISDVITCEDGFYILLRLPKEESYLTENFTDLKSQYQSAHFYQMIEERTALLTAYESEYVRELSPEEIQ